MTELELHKIDIGTVEALLKRARIRTPNLLALRERLIGGDTLAELEIDDMHSIFEHAGDVSRIFDHHPELQQLSLKLSSLYVEIIRLALDNERKGG